MLRQAYAPTSHVASKLDIVANYIFPSDITEALLATLNHTAQNVSGENDRMNEAALRLEALELLIQVSCALRHCWFVECGRAEEVNLVKFYMNTRIQYKCLV